MTDIQYGSLPVHYPLGKVYLFGDIHGEAAKLINVLAQVEPHITPEDHIVFLGDLFDRGLQSALVAETLINLVHKYPGQVFFVRGNHDYMLQNFIFTGNKEWFAYLQSTLDSFKEKWNLLDINQETITKALLDNGFTAVTSRTIPYYETSEIVATHAPLDLTTCMVYGLAHYEADYNDRANNPGFRYFLERVSYEILWEFTDESLAIPDFK